MQIEKLMIIMHKKLLFVFLVLGVETFGQSIDRVRTLIVLFDGLRPDYITAETMPNVYALSQQGCYATHHHSIFPTVTRVNASSYATGTYPAAHGIMGNTVYFPEVSTTSGLNTGEYENLQKISEATEGHLLTATSLGEALKKAGSQLMVFSSGSTGQAFLQNNSVNGAIIHPDLILPETERERILRIIGSPPAKETPNRAQHEWITSAFMHLGLAEDGPLVNAIWYSDPDGTSHRDGVGSPSAISAITYVDAQFGRILAALRERNLTDKFNIIITADHGFVTHVGKTGLANFLIDHGLKKSKESDDVVVAGGAIYLKDHDPGSIARIVKTLIAEEWVGAIFTAGEKAGEMTGKIPGTLSFESIHWSNPKRSADILVAVNWDNRKNIYGFAGTDLATGVAGHGGLSPYEVHIPLIATGPGFKREYKSDLPTGNIDIVPTILSLSGIPAPPSMTGRVMSELLRNGGNKGRQKPMVKSISVSSGYSGGTYHLTLDRTTYDGQWYIDAAHVVRK
jgi:predicted AlkP superfamily pyrophosphatase or phosphodiesterase